MLSKYDFINNVDSAIVQQGASNQISGEMLIEDLGIDKEVKQEVLLGFVMLDDEETSYY